MATERFDEARLIFTIRDSTAVHREEIAELIDALEAIDAAEADHIVAVSGEDERSYGPRPVETFHDALYRLMDEFLADDEGGFREMAIHATRHARWPQAAELWFQVRTAGAPSSVWLRHLVMRLDTGAVYAAIGGGTSGRQRHD